MRIHHVPRARGRHLEPANVTSGALARHESDVHFLIGTPLEIGAAGAR